MTEKLKQTIEKEAAELPKELQEAIQSIDWVNLSEKIGQENGLNEEEIEDLQLETLLVLIGVTDPQFYTTNIENQVEVTTEKAKILSEEAGQRIFIPIRQKLNDNIKKSLAVKKINWRQSIDFILSGGDYSSLLSNEEQMAETEYRTPNPPTLKDIKSKLVI